MCYSIAYLEKKAKKLAERYKDFFPSDWSEQQLTTMDPAASNLLTKQPTQSGIQSNRPTQTGIQSPRPTQTGIQPPQSIQTGILFPEDHSGLPKKHSGTQSDDSEALPSKPNDLPVYFFVSGFSHPLLPVIRQDGLHLCQWGLVPFWAKDAAFADTIRSKTLNAKGETVFEKPSFRGSIVSKRCLLPVNGFFEWREVNKVKYPYFIKLRDSDIFSLGCIFESWTDRHTGEMRDTFSIITTAANPMMEKIHNLKKRMPLIIGRDDEAAWVDPGLGAPGIKKLIKPFDEGNMHAHTVSRFLNNPRNERNVPEALKEVVYDELEWD
jgi:putative SOS response-associated peptidase YedK